LPPGPLFSLFLCLSERPYSFLVFACVSLFFPCQNFDMFIFPRLSPPLGLWDSTFCGRSSLSNLFSCTPFESYFRYPISSSAFAFGLSPSFMLHSVTAPPSFPLKPTIFEGLPCAFRRNPVPSHTNPLPSSSSQPLLSPFCMQSTRLLGFRYLVDLTALPVLLLSLSFVPRIHWVFAQVVPPFG